MLSKIEESTQSYSRSTKAGGPKAHFAIARCALPVTYANNSNAFQSCLRAGITREEARKCKKL